MLQQILYTDMRVRWILLLGVLFVLSTNHILIYNEEILIAFSFFGFVYFIREYFGSSIRSTLENRRNSLSDELSAVLEEKHTYLSEVLRKEEKKAERKQHVRDLVRLSSTEIHNFSTTCEQQLPRVINENLYRRLERLRLAVSNKFQAEIQSHLCDTKNLRSQVMYYLYCTTGRRKATQKHLLTVLYKQTVGETRAQSASQSAGTRAHKAGSSSKKSGNTKRSGNSKKSGQSKQTKRK